MYSGVISRTRLFFDSEFGTRTPDFERAKTDEGLRDRLIFLANGNDWIFSGTKF
jgi:hypothetical protein